VILPISICAALGGTITVATGQTAQVSPDQGAQQAFRAGVDAARQERWEEARVLFEKAYALSPRPVVLINLGGAQARTGRLTDAAKSYRRILAHPASPETASIRKAAAEVLPALEARIPRIRLRPTGLTPSDVIEIDGQTVPIEAMGGGGHPLDPGEHTLVVHQAGTERARVLFTLVERELRLIALPVPALGARPPPAPPLTMALPDSDVPGAPESTATRAWWRSPWTWTAVAVVVVGAATTSYLILEKPDDPFVGNIPPGVIDVR
jgi:hypothetical protein